MPKIKLNIKNELTNNKTVVPGNGTAINSTAQIPFYFAMTMGVAMERGWNGDANRNDRIEEKKLKYFDLNSI